jgi:hypothetical protein
MKRSGLVLLGMVMIFVVLGWVAGTESKPAAEKQAERQKQETDQVIWAGESGGFKIHWTDRDIQVHPLKSPNRVVFSARSLAQQEFARIKASEKKYGLKERYCEIVASYGIFSVVGSILSLFEGGHVDCEGTAHPSHSSRYIAIDLKKPGGFTKKRVKLTDYFPEEAIYQALLADPRVRRDLVRREPPLSPSPRTLGEIYALFKKLPLDDGESSYDLPEDFLTRFAFHHLEGDKVAVRLGLPLLGQVNAGLNLELNLLLPVPASLKEPLALAASGKEGFLSQDQERLSGGRNTIMQFTKGKKPPDW